MSNGSWEKDIMEQVMRQSRAYWVMYKGVPEEACKNAGDDGTRVLCLTEVTKVMEESGYMDKYVAPGAYTIVLDTGDKLEITMYVPVEKHTMLAITKGILDIEGEQSNTDQKT